MATVQRLEKSFERLIKNKRLEHSYLFFGSSVRALSYFAHALARYTETGHWQGEEPLRDVKIFDCSLDSGIKTARDLKYFLSVAPFRMHRRTAILLSLDKLTLSAQNAILKIAEEPPEHALIIATTKDSSSLIGTLASRFYKVYISDPKEGVVVSDEVLKLAREAMHLASGRGLGPFLKEQLEDEKKAEEFITALFAIHADHKKHWRVLKRLAHRVSVMQQFNTNKKLQLEAALLSRS